MGFGDGFVRFLQGKPIYKPEDVSAKEQQVAEQAGGKTIPVVRVEQVESIPKPHGMDVHATMRNDSPVNVQIHKLNMFGQVRQINQPLRSGEVRKIHVYSGDRPSHQNDHDAFLQYYDDSRDYFEAKHDVFFTPHDDNTYLVYELRIALPIKDIQ